MFKPLSILSLSIFGWIWGGPSASEQAKEKFEKGSFNEAKSLFQEAGETNPSANSEIFYNLAQCYRQMDSLQLASEFYEKAQRPGKNEINSMALNNKGVLQAKSGKKEDLEGALKIFQDALRQMPTNEHARFNYEYIKRLLEQKNETPPPPDSLPPPPQHNKPQPQEGSGQQDSIKPIPIESAREQLEALKQLDKKYLQELKKKYPGHHKPSNSPDW